MGQEDQLFSFVQGIEGTAWASNKQGWDQNIEVCEWQGVTCDDSGAVVTVDLEGTDLLATIPPSLGQMTSLTHVYLGSNKLHGTVPEELASLPNLIQIDLSMNKLHGSIPTMQSSRLEVMKFAHNQFSGGIPLITREDVKTLTILDIKLNRLGGTIPEMIASLSNLKDLDLSNNKFVGQIPESLGSLTKLEGLFLSNNMLVGSIPRSLTKRSLALTELFLHGNSLSGTVPVALADLPSLKILFIDENKLTGTIPQELCDRNLNAEFFTNYDGYNVDHLYADGGEEGGTAVLNESQSQNGANQDENGSRRIRHALEQNIDVGENDENKQQHSAGTEVLRDGCTSISCPVGYRSARSGGKDGVFPCEKCADGFFNPYLGSNECHELNQDHILKKFYVDTDGPNWSGGQSWSHDTVPACHKEGVSCNIAGDVVSIMLPGMKLSGTIPCGIGFLRHLEVLDLSDNELVGAIPSELRFAPLESLDVSGNRLTGFVPQELCQKEGVNGNGKGNTFSCDVIACPATSYSAKGRASAGGGGDQCIECPDSFSSEYIGSKICSHASLDSPPDGASSEESFSVAMLVAIISLPLFGGLLCLSIFMWSRTKERPKKRNERNYGNLHNDGDVYSYGDSDAHSTTGFILPSSTIPPPPDPVPAGTFPASVKVKVKDEWDNGKESTSEVWLDVPKIN